MREFIMGRGRKVGEGGIGPLALLRRGCSVSLVNGRNDRIFVL